mgnify:CR=1 FL=1
MEQIDRDIFLENISKFNFSILKDDGIYRHIKFGPHHITTWPGHLCIAGDMGTYVFSRLPDMFDFFRLSKTFDIDYRYWAEKCLSEDVNCKIRRFDQDRLLKIVEDILSIKYENQEQSNFHVNFWKEATRDVYTVESGYRLLDDLCSDLGLDITDYYEYNLTAYSYQFVWICNLISITISKYDKEKSSDDL